MGVASPTTTPSTETDTVVTNPSVSVALIKTSMLSPAVKAFPPAGLVIITSGDMSGTMVSSKISLPVPAALVTLTGRRKSPVKAGVPVITPVTGSSVNPSGPSPNTSKLSGIPSAWI